MQYMAGRHGGVTAPMRGHKGKPFPARPVRSAPKFDRDARIALLRRRQGR